MNFTVLGHFVLIKYYVISIDACYFFLKFLVDEWRQRIRVTIKLLNYCLPYRTLHQFRGSYAAHKSGGL